MRWKGPTAGAVPTRPRVTRAPANGHDAGNPGKDRWWRPRHGAEAATKRRSVPGRRGRLHGHRQDLLTIRRNNHKCGDVFYGNTDSPTDTFARGRG